MTQDPDTQALAGDQLYVDLDLSVDNLPPGCRIAVVEVVLEVSAKPHTGCAKFVRRFGPDAVRELSAVGRPTIRAPLRTTEKSAWATGGSWWPDGPVACRKTSTGQNSAWPVADPEELRCPRPPPTTGDRHG